jgi:hypothetical protein
MNSCTKETRQCSVCNMSVRKDLFSTKQWRLVVNPICRACINGENKTMRTKECSDCHKSVSKNQCPRKEWKKVNCVCRICYEYQRSSDSLIVPEFVTNAAMNSPSTNSNCFNGKRAMTLSVWNATLSCSPESSHQ